MANNYDNSGALFKNDRKERDNHPDYRGQATVDGREFWVSAWIKDGQKGKFMSMSFQPKEGSGSRGGSSRGESSRGSSGRSITNDHGGGYGGGFDDDVPF